MHTTANKHNILVSWQIKKLRSILYTFISRLECSTLKTFSFCGPRYELSTLFAKVVSGSNPCHVWTMPKQENGFAVKPFHYQCNIVDVEVGKLVFRLVYGFILHRTLNCSEQTQMWANWWCTVSSFCVYWQFPNLFLGTEYYCENWPAGEGGGQGLCARAR